MQTGAINIVVASLNKVLKHIEFDIKDEDRPTKKLLFAKKELDEALEQTTQANVQFAKQDSLIIQLKKYHTVVSELRKVIRKDEISDKRVNRELRSTHNDISVLVAALLNIVERRDHEETLHSKLLAAANPPADQQVTTSGTFKSFADLDTLAANLAHEKPVLKPVEAAHVDQEQMFNNYLLTIDRMKTKYAEVEKTIPNLTPEATGYVLFKAPVFVEFNPGPKSSAWERSNLPYEQVPPGVLIENQTIVGFAMDLSKDKIKKKLEKIVQVLKKQTNKTYTNMNSEYKDGFFKMPGSNLKYMWMLDSKTHGILGSIRMVYCNFPFIGTDKLPNAPKNVTVQDQIKAQRDAREAIENQLLVDAKKEYKLLEKYNKARDAIVEVVTKYRNMLKDDKKLKLNSQQEHEMETNSAALTAINTKIRDVKKIIESKREALIEKAQVK